jgi:hypothetical protein
MNKALKDLLRVANELDSRGLAKEADILDKLAGELIDFQRYKERKGLAAPESQEDITRRRYDEQESEARRNPKPPMSQEEHQEYMALYDDDEMDEIAERNSERLLAFLRDNLGEDAVVYDYTGDTTPLSDYLDNDSEELRDYMVEVMPDKIADLAQELGYNDPNALKETLLEEARLMDEYEEGSDFKFATDKMSDYLEELPIEPNPPTRARAAGSETLKEYKEVLSQIEKRVEEVKREGRGWVALSQWDKETTLRMSLKEEGSWTNDLEERRARVSKAENDLGFPEGLS